MLRHTDDINTLQENEVIVGVKTHHFGDNGGRTMFEIESAEVTTEEKQLVMQLERIDRDIANLYAQRDRPANRLMELQLRRQLESGAIKRRATMRGKKAMTKVATAAMMLMAVAFGAACNLQPGSSQKAAAETSTLPASAYATTFQGQPALTLEWDPPATTPAGCPCPPADTKGYFVLYGPSASTYSNKVDVGVNTRHTLTALTPGQRYYFVVTAYDANKVESNRSNEISGVFPGSTTAPVCPAGPDRNDPNAPIITTVYSWPNFVIANPRGLYVNFRVEGPARIKKMSIMLDALEFPIDIPAGKDGRDYRGFNIVPPAGVFNLVIKSTDERNCVGRTTVVRRVTIQ